MKHSLCSLLLIVTIGSFPAFCQDKALLNDEAAGNARLHRMSMGSSKLTVTGKPGADRGYVLTFAKAGNERRMVAVEIPVEGLTNVYKSLNATVNLKFDKELECRPVVYLRERESGRVWISSGIQLEAGTSQKIGVCLLAKRMRLLRYMQIKGESPEFDISKINQVSFGLLVDGVGEGELSIAALSLSESSIRATKPHVLELIPAKNWRGGADKAVKNIKYLDIKDGNDRVVRTEFTFPQNAHMFFLPTMHFPEFNYGMYSGIRLTYRAQLAPRLSNLLVMAQGTGGAYVFSGVKPTAEWKTVDLPFDACKGAGWLKQVKGKPLPVDSLMGLTVGCHGNASKTTLSWIEVKRIELYP